MNWNNNNIRTLNEIKKGQTGTGLLLERDGSMFLPKDVKSQIMEDIEHGHKFICPENLEATAICQRYDVKNNNGRVYPKNVLIPAVEKYISERVNLRCAISALDHPEASSLSGHDVAHLITEMHWEGNTLYGAFSLHLSPGFCRYGVCSTSGDLVANMLLQDYLIGVSSRALGSVENKGNLLMVQDDLDIVAFDSVLEPSTPSAFMKFERDELKPFENSTVEMQGSKLFNSMLGEKIDKINKILWD